MARRKPDEEEDLVPYYRPGTTEPEMVPRSSVPGYVEPGSEDESDGEEGLDQQAEDVAEEKPKRAAKKQVVKKK